MKVGLLGIMLRRGDHAELQRMRTEAMMLRLVAKTMREDTPELLEQTADKFDVICDNIERGMYPRG